jgi:hypothetical protein
MVVTTLTSKGIEPTNERGPAVDDSHGGAPGVPLAGVGPAAVEVAGAEHADAQPVGAVDLEKTRIAVCST